MAKTPTLFTGRDLRAVRLLRGLNQRELAALLGRNQVWVHRVETGFTALTPADEIRIARAQQ